jgi:hypothetical protein
LSIWRSVGSAASTFDGGASGVVAAIAGALETTANAAQSAKI